jgi:alkylation response protein AidB-like acyl-CoA dehydrogenase
MRFDLTDEQKSLRDMLTAFFGERFGAAQGVEAVADAELDPELWLAVTELGLAGAMVPESDGGLGLDLLTAAVIAEIVGRYAVPAPVVPSILAAWLIAAGGDEVQKLTWLPKLLGDGAQAAFALAEDGGWTPQDWTLSGAPLSGVKRYVERADSADLLIVGGKGGTLSIVERRNATLTPLDTLDRTRPLFDVAFDAADADPLAEGPALAAWLFDALCVCAAADALGAAGALQERAVEYAKERKQYGRLIGSFQALKHQLADMSVELEPARPLVWYAAHAWDMGQDDAPRMAALAKAHLTDISVAVSRNAIEALGGIGYTWEHPAHLFLKRAMHDRSAFGGVNAHRERAAVLAGWRL